MQSIRMFLRQVGAKLSSAGRHFMMGRYGSDKLNMAILGAGLLLSVVAIINPIPLIDLVLTILSYGLMFLAIFRMFSRNTYKRYQENRKYLMLKSRIKDREHRYYSCPRCHQTVRVPRNKGKIAITCPKCKEQFIKKT